MKYIKNLFVTFSFVIIILLVILLVLILLMYSPNTELPEEYRYVLDENEMSLEKYIGNFDFGSLQNIRIGEREINIVLNTYIKMGIEKNEDYSINYAYINLEESRVNGIAHLTIKEFMDFPIIVKIVVDTFFEEGVLKAKLKYIKFGAIKIPNFLIRVLLEYNEVESEYINTDNLTVIFDVFEINPYSDFIVIKNILINAEAIHVEIGISDYVFSSVKGTLNSAAKIIYESIEKGYDYLSDDEKKSADIIIEYIEENPNIDLLAIDFEEGNTLINEFMNLSTKMQDDILEKIRKQMSKDDYNELKEIIKNFLSE